MPKTPTFNYRDAANFIFEMGDLKRIKRSGWWHCKIRDPESVAEHSFRTSIIAYLVATLERHPAPERISFLALLHDLPESRLLDLHRISGAYVGNKNEIEGKILEEQEESLGMQLPWPAPAESILIKDADLLEMAFTAKEYAESGYRQAELLKTEAGSRLQLPSSRKLFSALEATPSHEWWAELGKKLARHKHAAGGSSRQKSWRSGLEARQPFSPHLRK